jgi:hypothetical protein
MPTDKEALPDEFALRTYELLGEGHAAAPENPSLQLIR